MSGNRRARYRFPIVKLLSISLECSMIDHRELLSGFVRLHVLFHAADAPI
jgi:hypothetical protein